MKIKQAYKSLAPDDTKGYPGGQATYNDKSINYMIITPYGLFSNAPIESHIVLLNQGDQSAVQFGIENDYERRIKDLKPGEVYLINTLTGSKIFLKENGDIEIDSANDVKVTAKNINAVASGDCEVTAENIKATASSKADITAPTINLTGDVVISGNLALGGGMTGAGGTAPVQIDTDMNMTGDLDVDGSITATGNIIDGSANTNHHTHP